MTLEIDVSVVYDGKALIPDHPVDLEPGKKYHIIIEHIPPDDPQKTDHTDQVCISETAYMSERVLAREWMTSEEDEAWEYL